MNLRRVSAGVIIATVVLVVGYDLVPAFMTPGQPDTISEVLADWTGRAWFLPYFGGVLVGHFWLRVPWARSRPTIWVGIGLLMVALSAAGLSTYDSRIWALLLASGALAGTTWFPLPPPKRPEEPVG